MTYQHQDRIKLFRGIAAKVTRVIMQHVVGIYIWGHVTPTQGNFSKLHAQKMFLKPFLCQNCHLGEKHFGSYTTCPH